MPDPISGIIAGVGSIASAALQGDAAGDAAQSQERMNAAAIAEQRAAREELRKLLQPYVAAGGSALEAQMDLAGLGGVRAQREAILGIESSPIFRSLARQGETAILQNASATGGLRGGNVQEALAQYRPAMLDRFIEQQYGRLAGLTQMGQNSAAGVGTAGMQSAGQIGNIMMDTGAAQAGARLAQGQAVGNTIGSISQLLPFILSRGSGGTGMTGFF